jgi:hypothetical protein
MTTKRQPRHRDEWWASAPRPVRTLASLWSQPHVQVDRWRYLDDGSAFGRRHDGAIGVEIRAGWRGMRRIVPPAGEDYAYDSPQWARRVTVHVSPTGRSVRVFVDGREIPADSPA